MAEEIKNIIVINDNKSAHFFPKNIYSKVWMAFFYTKYFIKLFDYMIKLFNEGWHLSILNIA
jgi:hypothetical protein